MPIQGSQQAINMAITAPPEGSVIRTPEFSPDFQKENPLEGAPKSYLDKIQNTAFYEEALGKGWITPEGKVTGKKSPAVVAMMAELFNKPKQSGVDYDSLTVKLREAVKDKSDVRLITSDTIPPQYADKPDLKTAGAFYGNDGLLYIITDNVDNVDEAIREEKAHKLLQPYETESTKITMTTSPDAMYKSAYDNIKGEIQANILTQRTFGIPDTIKHKLAYQLTLHEANGVPRQILIKAVDDVMAGQDIPKTWREDWNSTKNDYATQEPIKVVKLSKYRRAAPTAQQIINISQSTIGTAQPISAGQVAAGATLPPAPPPVVQKPQSEGNVPGLPYQAIKATVSPDKTTDTTTTTTTPAITPPAPTPEQIVAISQSTIGTAKPISAGEVAGGKVAPQTSPYPTYNLPLAPPPFDLSTSSGVKAKVDWIENHLDSVTQADKNWATIEKYLNYSTVANTVPNLKSLFVEQPQLDSAGNPTPISVTIPATVWNTIQGKSPADRLPDLVTWGIVPKGTEPIVDIVAYNKTWGLNKTADRPYAFPDELKGIQLAEEKQSAQQLLQNLGDIGATWKAGDKQSIDNLRATLKVAGITDYQINSILDLLDAGAITPKGNVDVAKAYNAGVKDISVLYEIGQGRQIGTGIDLQTILSYYPKDVVQAYKDTFGDYWERAITNATATTPDAFKNKTIITPQMYLDNQNFFATFNGVTPIGTTYNILTGMVNKADGSQVDAKVFTNQYINAANKIQDTKYNLTDEQAANMLGYNLSKTVAYTPSQIKDLTEGMANLKNSYNLRAIANNDTINQDDILTFFGASGGDVWNAVKQIRDTTTQSKAQVSNLISNNNIQVANKANMSVSDMVSVIKAGLKSGNTNIAQQLLDDGQNETNVQQAVNQVNNEATQANAVYQKQMSALTTLTGWNPQELQMMETAKFPAVGNFIQKYIANNPTQETIQLLKDAQLDETTRDNATRYINEIQNTTSAITANPDKWNSAFTNDIVAQIQAKNLGLLNNPNVKGVGLTKDIVGDIAGLLGVNFMTVGIKDFNAFWNSLSQADKNRYVAAINADVNRSNAYAALMENIDYYYNQLPEAAKVAIMFVPKVGMPLTAGHQVADLIVPYTISNKTISRQIQDNAEYIKNSTSLTSDEAKALESSMKSAGIKYDIDNPLSSYQKLSVDQQNKIATEYTRNQLGLDPSTFEKVQVGLMVVAAALSFVGGEPVGGLGGGLLKGVRIAVPAAFIGMSVPTLISPKVSIGQKIETGAFDALMAYGIVGDITGKGIASKGAAVGTPIKAESISPEVDAAVSKVVGEPKVGLTIYDIGYGLAKTATTFKGIGTDIADAFKVTLDAIKATPDYFKYNLKADVVNSLRNSEAFIKDISAKISEGVVSGYTDIVNASRMAVANFLDVLEKTGDYLKYGLKADTINALRNSEAFIKDLAENIQNKITTSYTDFINTVRSGGAFAKSLVGQIQYNVIASYIDVDNAIRDALTKVQSTGEYLRYNLPIDVVNTLRNNNAFIKEISEQVQNKIANGYVDTVNAVNSTIRDVFNKMQETGDYLKYGLKSDTINAIRNSEAFMSELADQIQHNIAEKYVEISNASNTIIRNTLEQMQTAGDYLKYGLKADTINVIRNSEAFIKDLSDSVSQNITSGYVDVINASRNAVRGFLDGLEKTGDYVKYGLKADTINLLRNSEAFVNELADKIQSGIQQGYVDFINVSRSAINDVLDKIEKTGDYLKYGLKADTINVIRNSEAFIKDTSDKIQHDVVSGYVDFVNTANRAISSTIDGLIKSKDYLKYGLKIDTINALRESKAFIGNVSDKVQLDVMSKYADIVNNARNVRSELETGAKEAWFGRPNRMSELREQVNARNNAFADALKSIRAAQPISQTKPMTDEEKAAFKLKTQETQQKILDAYLNIDKIRKVAAQYPDDETVKSTLKWAEDIRNYAIEQLKLEQAQKDLTDLLLAKPKDGETSQIDTLSQMVKDTQKSASELANIAKTSGKDYVDAVAKIEKARGVNLSPDWKDNPRQAVEEMKSVTKEIVNPRTVETIKADIEAITDTINKMQKVSATEIDLDALARRENLLAQLNKELGWSRLGQTKELSDANIEAQRLAGEIEKAATSEIKTELQRQLADILAKQIELRKLFAESVYRTTEPVERYVQKGTTMLSELKSDMDAIKNNEARITDLKSRLAGVQSAKAKVDLQVQISDLEDTNKIISESLKGKLNRFSPYYEEAPQGVDFGGLMYNLDYLANRISAKIKDSELAEQVTKNLNDLANSVAKGDKDGIKQATDNLAGNSDKIQVRLKEYLDSIKQAKADREAALQKIQDAKDSGNEDTVNKAKEAYDEFLKKEAELFKETASELTAEQKEQDNYNAEKQRTKQLFAEWEKTQESFDSVAQQAKIRSEKEQIAQSERFNEFLTDREKENLSKRYSSAENAKNTYNDVLKSIRDAEKELGKTDWGKFKIEDEFATRQYNPDTKEFESIPLPQDMQNRFSTRLLNYAKSKQVEYQKALDASAKGQVGLNVDSLKVEADNAQYLNDVFQKEGYTAYKQAEAEVALENMRGKASDAYDFYRTQRGYYQDDLDFVYKRIADAKFEGNVSALQKYIETGEVLDNYRNYWEDSELANVTFINPKGTGLNVNDATSAIDELEKLLKENSGLTKDAVLKELGEILKKPSDTKIVSETEATLQDIEKSLKLSSELMTSIDKLSQEGKENWARFNEIEKALDKLTNEAEEGTGRSREEIQADIDKLWEERRIILDKLWGETGIKSVETPKEPQEPTPRGEGGEGITTKEKVKTEVETKTAEELEKELYEEEKVKPTEKPITEEAAKKLEKAKERVSTEVKVEETPEEISPIEKAIPEEKTKTTPTPFALPQRRLEVGVQAETVPVITTQPLIGVRTGVKEMVAPLTTTMPQIFTEPQVKPSIQTEIKPQIKPATTTEIQTQPQIQVQPETATQTAVQTATQVEIKPEIKPQTETQPITQLQTQTQVATQIATPTSTQIEIKKPIIPPIPPSGGDTSGLKKVEIPYGAVTYRQGNHWGYITQEELAKPDAKKEIVWLKEGEIPAGIYKFATGKGSSYKTLQILPKGARLPTDSADVDMGWATIHITQEPSGELKMSFAGGKQAAEDRWDEERQVEQAIQSGAYIPVYGAGIDPTEVSLIPRGKYFSPLDNVKEVYPPDIQAQREANEGGEQPPPLSSGQMPSGNGQVIFATEKSQIPQGKKTSLDNVKDTYIPPLDEPVNLQEEKIATNPTEQVQLGVATDMPQHKQMEEGGGQELFGKSLNKVLLPEYSKGDIKVYSVDDAWIRNNWVDKEIGVGVNGIDWNGGGHHYVYPYLITNPNEVWVGRDFKGEDRDAYIVHELEERGRMEKLAEKEGVKKIKYSQYSDIHEKYANPVEMELRKNPEKTPELLEKYLGYKPQSYDEYINNVIETARNKNRQKASKDYDKRLLKQKMRDNALENEDEENLVLIPEHYRRKKATPTENNRNGEVRLPTRKYLGVSLRNGAVGIGI